MVATLQEAFGNTFIENFGDVVAGTDKNNPNYRVGKAKSNYDCEQPRFINNKNCNNVILDIVCAQGFTCNRKNECEEVKSPDQEKLIRCQNN